MRLRMRERRVASARLLLGLLEELVVDELPEDREEEALGVGGGWDGGWVRGRGWTGGRGWLAA